jgi:DME family drug/metabolite transporter
VRRGSALAGSGLVLFSCTLWGITGLIIRKLIDLGLTPVQVTYYANGLAFFLLLGGLMLRAPQYLRIRWREFPLIAAIGAIGTGLSLYFYSTAVALVGVSLTSLLISTAPAWVTLFAWRILGEPIQRSRVAVVAVSFVGCALVAQVYDPVALNLNAPGVLFGLTCGLTNGLYLVLAKRALRKYHPLTVSVYALGGAALVLLPLQPAPLPTALSVPSWLWLALFAVGDVLIGPLVYNSGLRWLEAGVVSVLSLWELIVALVLAALLLGESLALPQLLGALLVAGSVFSLGLGAPAEMPVAEVIASSPEGLIR